MKKEDNIIRISFLGDLMCTIPMTQKAERKTGYDFKPVFENIKDSLINSDYVVGNLETPLAGADCLYTFHPTEFNTPDEFALAAYEVGIKMFTTANNHSLDRGLYGLKRTLTVLDQIGAEHVGTQLRADMERTFYKTIGGIKCAFISYTYDTNSPWMNNKLKEEDLYHINLFKEQENFPKGGEGYEGPVFRRVLHSIVPDLIKDIIRDKSKVDCGELNDVASSRNKRYEDSLFTDIKRAKHKSDYVFVCLHIGGQYNNKIGAYTDKIVNKCKEAGAHYVICNHPHCVLPISLDGNSNLVAYALGNFCYTPNWGYYVDGKYSEYSIVLHLLFSTETKKICDIRFSILKSVDNKINTQVYNIYDLYRSETNNRILKKTEKELSSILYRLLKLHIEKIEIKEEYSICEFMNKFPCD
ncbi:CapA family protein [uncultured Bacteroides sp.]|uniref:CapA family protein n=1 Tax=uncultured Bacteroides sp. TaxID=162156 RepID=UPI00259AE448|nr:CapA family protein [uncultured Bacteroides sp.]